MLTINGKDIKISYGDTFNVIFQVTGYEFKDTDVVTFTIKKGIYSSETLITKTFNNIQNNQINVLINSDDMENLNVGDYVYDLVCQSGDVVLTLNYPSKLKIVGVVHNDV